MPRIPLRNINLGGIADSDFMGAANSVADMVGFDLHSEAGILKVNQALTKESGSTVDDFVKAGVPCSDGNTYLFGSTNGKVWKRDNTGAYTLVATIAPATGSAGVLDAMEYYGYIYYATQNYLGRVAVGAAWSTRNDSWQAFTNGDTSWHPMLVLNLVLYIGDASYISQVDSSGGSDVFSAKALNLGTPFRAKCLGQLGTDLLIGTYVSSNLVRTSLFRWNTWSISFTSSDPVPEIGINSFLPIENTVIVNAGLKGNLYLYNGSSLTQYKGIKGTWDNTSKQGYVHPNARLNFNGLPLFGLSNVSGNPANTAVYSLGRTNNNYPIVLNCEVGISTGNLSNIEIGAIIGLGNQYLVTWKDTTSGTVYGVDVLDLTAKYASPYIVTRILTAEAIRLRRIQNQTIATRTTSVNFGTVAIGYRTLPAGCGYGIASKRNYGSFVANDSADILNDTDRNIVYTKVDMNSAATIQVKVSPIVNGNTAPETDLIELGIDL